MAVTDTGKAMSDGLCVPRILHLRILHPRLQKLLDFIVFPEGISRRKGKPGKSPTRTRLAGTGVLSTLTSAPQASTSTATNSNALLKTVMISLPKCRQHRSSDNGNESQTSRKLLISTQPQRRL